MEITKLVLLATTPSPDFWHDPFGQFIATNAVTFISSIIAAIIGGVIAIWIYQKQRSKKVISYQIISDASILSVGKKIANRVKIELDGNPVKEVTLVVFKVSNIGNSAVDDKDYKESLTFAFSTRKVISTEVIETEPKDLIDPSNHKQFISIPVPGQTFVEFPNFLLNPKQSVTFSVLLDGKKDKISKKGRIVDGNIIQLNPEEELTYILTKAFIESFNSAIPIIPIIVSIISLMRILRSNNKRNMKK